MTINQSTIACGLTATATPSISLNKARPIIGSASNYAPSGVTIAAAMKVESVATGNVATLDIASGDIAQSTGSPMITGAGKDFEGVDLGTAETINGIRIKASGTGTVTIGGSNSGLFPALVMQSGSDIVMKFPTAGSALAGTETVTFTFSASGGIIELEYLAQ